MRAVDEATAICCYEKGLAQSDRAYVIVHMYDIKRRY